MCLFLFLFSLLLRGGSKKILLLFVAESVLPIFSFKSFIMSILTFWSWIHFEFIFVDGVRECSDFILIHVAVQFSQHCLLRRLSFLHCIVLLPLIAIACSILWSQGAWSCQLLLFFLKIVLALQGVLYFHTHCKIFCSSCVKNAFGNLIEIALNL